MQKRTKNRKRPTARWGAAGAVLLAGVCLAVQTQAARRPAGARLRTRLAGQGGIPLGDGQAAARRGGGTASRRKGRDAGVSKMTPRARKRPLECRKKLFSPLFRGRIAFCLRSEKRVKPAFLMRQGGFQPMTAPLLGTDAPLFSRSTHFKLTILISQNPPFGKGKFLNWENGRKKARFCPRSRQHVPPPCWTRAFSGGKIGYSRRGRLRPGSPGYTTTKYRRFFAA